MLWLCHAAWRCTGLHGAAPWRLSESCAGTSDCRNHCGRCGRCRNSGNAGGAVLIAIPWLERLEAFPSYRTVLRNSDESHLICVLRRGPCELRPLSGYHCVGASRCSAIGCWNILKRKFQVPLRSFQFL